MPKDDLVACPHCGELIKRKAKACPHCGSDEETGWSDATYLDGIDLGDDFDYDEMLNKEFGNGKQPVTAWLNWRSVTALLMLILFIFIVVYYW